MIFYSIPDRLVCARCGITAQTRITDLPFATVHCVNSLCDDYLKEVKVEFPDAKIMGAE